MSAVDEFGNYDEENDPWEENWKNDAKLTSKFEKARFGRIPKPKRGQVDEEVGLGVELERLNDQMGDKEDGNVGGEVALFEGGYFGTGLTFGESNAPKSDASDGHSSDEDLAGPVLASIPRRPGVARGTDAQPLLGDDSDDEEQQEFVGRIDQILERAKQHPRIFFGVLFIALLLVYILLKGI